MSRAARLLWVCAVTALLCFVGLAVLSTTALQPEGMAIFDSRLGGYTPSDARAYLAAVTPAQVAAYLGPFRQLDTVFPVLLTISLMGSIWLNSGGEARFRRITFLLGPAVYLALDLTENASVAQMLRDGVGVLDAQVQQASIYTRAKWMCLALSLLVVVWAWRFAAKEPET